MEKVKTRNIRFVVDDELERKGVQLYELVENCDIMLTDYSSIFYDFLLLNRPVGFLISDINEYTRGFFYSDPLSQMPGEKIRTAEELTRFFDKVNAGEDDWADERERIKNMVFTYQDANNCKRLLSFIEEHKQ
ncbi:MAG: CDP-glycerol glycerophosphotransferase family protein [Firmicutes bacterium]|nr:CDP-glycerol glycerophosphotransferase family protein [Bacillota bacterium]